MNEILSNHVPDEMKKILKSKVESHCSLIEFAIARIFICYDGEEDFQFTNLEGCLCLMVNRDHSCLFLQLYDYSQYEKQFEIEIYTNIEKGYMVLHDYFHCIEYQSFSIGLNFSNKTSAQKMKNSIFYNSIMLNMNCTQLKLARLGNEKKKDEKVTETIKKEFENNTNNNSKSIIKFSKDQEILKVIYEVSENDFNSSIAPMQVFLKNVDIHKDKLEASFKADQKEIGVKNITSEIEPTKFIQYDLNKRTSIYQNTNSLFAKKGSVLNPDTRPSYIKTNPNLRVITLNNLGKK
jgi:hypothetical protein